MISIDLNADLGEGVGDDEAMSKIISTANLAAGGHAGGGEVLRESLRLAKFFKVKIGAHPSYLDLKNFGRTSLLDKYSETELELQIFNQIMLVGETAAEFDISITHVKAHGGLYNDASDSPKAAVALLNATERAAANLGGSPLAIMGMPFTVLQNIAMARSLTFIAEGFADRAYNSAGRLVDRRQIGSVYENSEVVVKQALSIASHQNVIAITGEKIQTPVQTICLHGDNPQAVSFAREIVAQFKRVGIHVKSVGGEGR